MFVVAAATVAVAYFTLMTETFGAPILTKIVVREARDLMKSGNPIIWNYGWQSS
jgi:hypothetical protein